MTYAQACVCECVRECNSKLNLHLCRRAFFTFSSNTEYLFQHGEEESYNRFTHSTQFAIVHTPLYYHPFFYTPHCLFLSHALSIFPSPTYRVQVLLFSSVHNTLNTQLPEDAAVFILLILWLLKFTMLQQQVNCRQ